MTEHRLVWWSGDPVAGGQVRLVAPDVGRAAFECGLLPGAGRTVLLADHSVPPPAAGARESGTLEVRAAGLWAELVVEEAGEHLSVGLEAFAVAVDDPDDAWRGGPDHLFRGDRIPVGLDLGAERCAEPVEVGGARAIPCGVVGEVLVADEVHAVDGWGWWMVGPLPDVHALGRDGDGGWLASGPREVVEVLGRVPVLGVDGRPVDRRLVRLTADGRPGVGWVEESAPPEG